MNNKLDGATVTEAHRALVKSCMNIQHPAVFNSAAQLIADSEARVVAAAVVTLEARITSDEELFHDIRMKLTAACGDPYKLHDEALDAIITERDRLRAEVERLIAQRDNLLKPMRDEAIARAELAEAELEEARKDSKRYRYIAWKSDTNPIMIIKLNDNILLHGYDANEAIDAAMKGETK